MAADQVKELRKRDGRAKAEIVFLDIRLPGMSGYDVAKQLQRPDKRWELIAALTGYGQAEDRERSPFNDMSGSAKEFHMLLD